MDWLQALIERLTCFIPRPTIMTVYEAGLRFTFGKHIKDITNGWFWWIPLFQRIQWMDIQTQVVDLRSQSVRTSDGQSVIVSGAIQYSVKDVRKAILNVQNVDTALEKLALGIILEFVKSKTVDECHDIEALKKEILRGIKEAAQGWGLKIERVFITDLDKTINIRLLTNGTVTV
jgi:regulator of protease activity HflC (stomatin/prohibitin superfamily)